MRLFFILVFFTLFSCGNQETVLLPKSNVSIVKEVVDLSPVYIFFKENGKGTLAEVNRKNVIISTNWVFNIDKRLPLRLVIPEVMKLQDKKRNDSAHKNELAQNYYTYTDSIQKNLAFLPFTEVYYKLEKPKFGVIVFFDKSNEILVNGIKVKLKELQVYLTKLPSDKPNTFVFCFDKNLDYGSYLQAKIFIESISVNNKSKEEFIY